jgi:hypothetical protein
VSTFWSGRFRDTLSIGPELRNTGNKTYSFPILIPTSWSVRWEIIGMVPILDLAVSIYTMASVRYRCSLHGTVESSLSPT